MEEIQTQISDSSETNAGAGERAAFLPVVTAQNWMKGGFSAGPSAISLAAVSPYQVAGRAFFIKHNHQVELRIRESLLCIAVSHFMTGKRYLSLDFFLYITSNAIAIDTPLSSHPTFSVLTNIDTYHGSNSDNSFRSNMAGGCSRQTEAP